MGILDDKLAQLYAEDDGVRAEMEDAGAVTKATKDKPLKLDAAKLSYAIVAKAKACVHGDLKPPEPFEFHGIRIHVTGMSLEGDLLRVDLSASCPTDGPYYFQNPPLQVVAGEEDPAAALVTIIGEAVEATALRLGSPWLR